MLSRARGSIRPPSQVRDVPGRAVAVAVPLFADYGLLRPGGWRNGPDRPGLRPAARPLAVDEAQDLVTRAGRALDGVLGQADLIDGRQFSSDLAVEGTHVSRKLR